MAVIKFVLFVALCASVLGTVIKIRPCEEYSQDICSVSQVRVTPCANENRCTIKKSNNVSISFDYTPNFGTSKAKTMVYGLIVNSYEPFMGFGSDDACSYTSCPTEAGKTQTYNYNMYLQPKTPKGSYDLKWKLWNEDNDQDMCCFKFAIRIR